MTEEEKISICKAICLSCMWGHGGIGSIVIEKLDEYLPQEYTWKEMLKKHSSKFIREHIGVISEEKELLSYLYRGYWITNFDDHGASLFNPPPMNGLYKYISKELSDKRRFR